MRSTEYEIYVDLDGVMVDFAKLGLKLASFLPDDDPANKKLRSKFWNCIGDHCKDGNTFFESMEPMPDAFVLWEYVKPYDPTILSATGTSLKNAAVEKRNWVATHIDEPTASEAIFVENAKAKAAYAKPKAILIDDRIKAIEPFIEAGGIGILHISAEDTIRQLKELGL